MPVPATALRGKQGFSVRVSGRHDPPWSAIPCLGGGLKTRPAKASSAERKAIVAGQQRVTGLQSARGAITTPARARPNQSLNRSPNGRPPSPGRRYTVHFRQPGLGVLPSAPG